MQCEETGRGREGNYRNCNELGGKGRRPGTVTKMYAKDFLLRPSRERGVVLSFQAHIYSRRHELLLQMEKRQLQEQSIWQGRRVEPGLQAEGLVYGRSNRTSMAMGGEGRGQQGYSACSSDGHPTSRLSVVSSMGSLPYLYPH